MYKIIDRLKSIYHIFTKEYALFWSKDGTPLPNKKCIGVIFLYDDRIVVDGDAKIPLATIETVRNYLKLLEDRNA